MDPQRKPQIMILGTFHMRHTPDLYRVDASDVLAPERQKEIRFIIDRIKEFKPTKVALEVIKEENDRLNHEYQKYLNDKANLEINEIHQLGFRLAEEMGHEEIYAVDWMDTVGNLGIGQVYEWAKENQPQMYNDITQKYPIPNINELKSKSIYEYIRELNEKEQAWKNHQLYMQVARIGEGTNYIGIDWVRWWYQRNLTIYSNLANITDTLTDRTIMIVGYAHLHLLSQFLTESGEFDVISAQEYLT
ncbi:DUF5694 domain-containing protein [Pontibacillus yanchengensis]|uniref:Uncharacterized protein n=1 Tax=Pontibacillus yanchengensis Y32 TaxID=1385514 RepID=A0A0A2T6B9_9BACI|nr:DUF5694 domain-containing protein [Pontibacillus yanchengensis]KGP71044.1 hypothetical protein N782_01660 [Pontibacillus yanchengensis Y32]